MNRIKQYLISAAIIFPLWTILWIPVSFLFEQHPVMPTALLAPLVGFTSLTRVEGWQQPVFPAITFPWMIYWFVLIAGIILLKRRRSEIT